MAFPKKGTRKITVNNIQYQYRIAADEWGVEVLIQAAKGQVLSANFSHQATWTTNFKTEKEELIFTCPLQQKAIITPKIVRQIIEYGHTKGWHPSTNKGSVFGLGQLNEVIQIELKGTKIFPILQGKEVALSLEKFTPQRAKALKIENKVWKDKTTTYWTIASFDIAQDFAKQIVAYNLGIKCRIFCEPSNIRYLISSEEEQLWED